MSRSHHWRYLSYGSWAAQCRAIAAALLLVLLSSGLFSTFTVHAKGPAAGSHEQMSRSQLPPQGQAMMTLIDQGGPFQYDKDGTVFGNRERLLPARQRGYYREYTVKTPGERHRGARRIVCGGEQPTAPEACYYTEDHYASYRQIVR
jgi:ribonuclease T1